MITIESLKNYPQCIRRCAEIWQEVLGKIWLPDVSVNQIIQNLQKHLNEETLPLTLIALDDNQVVGMCSLRENDGIRPELTPWLGSLVVDSKHQKKGIGELMINCIKSKAASLGYDKIYLFAFDPTIPQYYARLGWSEIGIDQFKGKPVTVMEIEL